MNQNFLFYKPRINFFGCWSISAMRDVEVTVSSGELQTKALVRPNIASASANRLFRYCFSGVLLVFAVCLIVAIKVLPYFLD